jgi:hypothetical protein
MGPAPDLHAAARELARALVGRGVRLSLADGAALRVEPASQLTNEDRQAIRALKPELVRMLGAEPAADESSPIVLFADINKIIDQLEAQIWAGQCIKTCRWYSGKCLCAQT